jgi:hypothetical protein
MKPPFRDEDGRCSRCGLEWPDEKETLEPHECPPGFTSEEPEPWRFHVLFAAGRVGFATFRDAMKVAHWKPTVIEPIHGNLWITLTSAGIRIESRDGE